jgi:hypothetical protein
VVAVVFGLFIIGALSPFGAFGFGIVGIEGLVALVTLLPVFLVIGLLWFGREVFLSLRKIEATVGQGSHVERELSHVA